MASRQRAKRRKTVPSAKEQQAAFGAAANKKKKKRGNVRSLDGVEAPLKPTDVEAAHERREQARAVEDMASRAATASQLERATCRLERYQNSIRSSSRTHGKRGSGGDGGERSESREGTTNGTVASPPSTSPQLTSNRQAKVLVVSPTGR